MSWDRASLPPEISQSLPRDEWEDHAYGRSTRFFSRLNGPRAAQPASVQVDDLNVPEKRARRRKSSDGFASGGGALHGYRLLAGYKNGDREVSAGRDLFGIGEANTSIFNLLAGWVAIYTLLTDGRRQIVHFALPGAIIGVPRSKGARSTYAAQALTDVVVSAIPTNVMAAAVQNDPVLGINVATMLARDVAMAYDHMTSIGRRNARERVACLLLELFVRCRAQWPGTHPEEMEIPLTQEQIGDATGLTFVHVNRVLSTMRKEGIVRFHYRSCLLYTSPSPRD